MPVPTPRCFVCEKKIPNWSSQRGQHPKYCGPVCQALGRVDPRCGRCKEPLSREHFSQRYHEQCAAGCKVCGKPLRAKQESRMPKTAKATKAGHLPPIYCSEGCQEYAWKGDTLPTCRVCKETVELPKAPRALRNPAKMHRECRPRPDGGKSAHAIELELQEKARLAAEAARAEREKANVGKSPKQIPVNPKSGRKRPGTKYPNPFEDDDPLEEATP